MIGDIPPTSTPAMLAIAEVLKAREPDIHKLIIGLEGNPRIFKVAYGYNDHLSFLVDCGFGERARSDIHDFCKGDSRVRVSIHWTDGADIVTWWA